MKIAALRLNMVPRLGGVMNFSAGTVPTLKTNTASRLGVGANPTPRLSVSVNMMPGLSTNTIVTLKRNVNAHVMLNFSTSVNMTPKLNANANVNGMPMLNLRANSIPRRMTARAPFFVIMVPGLV